MFALLSNGYIDIVGSLERPDEHKPAKVRVYTATLTSAHTRDNPLAILKHKGVAGMLKNSVFSISPR